MYITCINCITGLNMTLYSNCKWNQSFAWQFFFFFKDTRFLFSAVIINIYIWWAFIYVKVCDSWTLPACFSIVLLLSLQYFTSWFKASEINIIMVMDQPAFNAVIYSFSTMWFICLNGSLWDQCAEFNLVHSSFFFLIKLMILHSQGEMLFYF